MATISMRIPSDARDLIDRAAKATGRTRTDFMLETAQAVARNLGGDVLDESRSVLTRQAIEHARQQIRDMERRLLAKAR